MKHSKWSNVVCTVPGTKDGVIIVGAHFDHVSAGDGVVDNWSGASLLPALLSSLKIQPRNHTFLFVAFADEESGLSGSRYFVRSMRKEERADVRAMVNIDSIGLGTAAIWESRSDKTLLRTSYLVAKTLGVKLDAVNVEKVGDSDSASFRDVKIPVIDFHSVHQDTLRILHSPKDVFAAIDMTGYADTFRLIATFLGLIDQTLP